MKRAPQDTVELINSEPREKRVRVRDGKTEVTSDGVAKKPCELCGARTRRRGLEGLPQCADCYCKDPRYRKG